MTDTRLTNASASVDSRSMVSADQQTIFGNGTSENPLRSTAGSTFLAQFVNAFADPNEPRVGNVVVATPAEPSVGIATVRTGSAGLGTPQLPQAIGILVEAGAPGTDGGEVTVRSTGPVTLTEGQWDLVTGGSGGLDQGSIYYLDWGFDSFGKLTTVKPTDDGMVIVQVGVATSSTTMLLSLPAVPILIT